MTKEAEESRKAPDENVQWDVCLMSFFLGQSGIRFWYSRTVGLQATLSIDLVIPVFGYLLNFFVDEILN